jgi:hypothetical protein
VTTALLEEQLTFTSPVLDAILAVGIDADHYRVRRFNPGPKRLLEALRLRGLDPAARMVACRLVVELDQMARMVGR